MLSLAAPVAHAAPDEIQVYTEEMDDPGEFGLELHVNYSAKGNTAPSYEGEVPPNHMLQVTPEFSYGITKQLEAGLYVPFAMSPDGNTYNNGLRFRLKYIAPRADDQPFFWGINTELGYYTRRVSESDWGMELRPIIGYRTYNWLVSFNPILDAELTNNVDHDPSFEPALKVSRRVSGTTRAGLEYYGGFGAINHPLPKDQRDHYLYAAVDYEQHGYDINFGIGRGYTQAPDKWVVKAIIAFPFK